jgi:MFS family permease
MITATSIETAGTGLEGSLRARPRIVTRPLLVRLVSMLGAAISFYLLLSVVPLYATSAGGGGATAGLATGALLFSSVAGELVTPRLVARYGYRLALAAGLALLGAPALLLMGWASTASIVAVCALRGLGFGIACVAGSALTASLIPPERRGEGLALLGVIAGIPSLVALPAGVWLAGRIGYAPVFAAGAVAALAALPSLPGLPDGPSKPGGRRVPGQDRPIGVVAGLRMPALARPSLTFSATTMAAGIVVTFLPLAVMRPSGNLAGMALLTQPAVSTLARYWAGRYSDRRGAAGLLIPGLLASAAGMLALALTSSPAAVIGGAAVFGAGFGITQNASLTLMYARVPQSWYGTVSALWNLAYDAGMGLGAAGFGVLAVHTGYPAGFALAAAAMLAALVPAVRDRAPAYS